MNIITRHICPAIPDRSHDWMAYNDANCDDHRCGYGPTAEAAIRDLLEQLGYEEVTQ